LDQFLTLSAADRAIAFQQAEARLRLPAASIEKDFWVCFTLRALFSLPDWQDHLTFKGGTSLSKAWDLIQRFSEDIDLVIDRPFLGIEGDAAPENAPSAKQRRKRVEGVKEQARAAIQERLLPTLEQHLATVIPPVIDWKLVADPDDPDRQTLLFHYPGVLQPKEASLSPYVRPVVRVELGARSDTEPLEYCEIEPDIARVFPAAVGPGRFTVRVVSPKRTFIEKAMLLHEQACRKTPKPPRARLSRHYYDVYCLIGAGIADAALTTEGLFATVVRHRAIYFPESLHDDHGYDGLTPAGLRLRPASAFLSDWRADYQKMRESMFYGPSPDFEEVLREVGRFEDGLRGR
jgi:hypothetical protein